jgi:Carbohydrate-selective porin, OprB family/S-layer homology domain
VRTDKMLNKVLLNSLLVTPAVLGAAVFASSAIAADSTSVSDSATALTTEVSAPVATENFVPSIAPAEVAAATVEPATSVVESTAEVSTEAPVVELTAIETPAIVSQVPAAEQSTPSVASLEQVMQYGNEGTDSMGQVTSISQLSDVLPTDWAFQALQSLVERYGCIAGYPDGTYRGNRAMTRYEFAAGLNACMDRVSELIAEGLANAVTREDLAALERLQQEFAAELATLRGRVDSLEARVTELEANQFSTTTVLRADAIFMQTAAFGQDDVFDDQAVFLNRVRLNFDTSFTGEDLLRTRLHAGRFPNFDSDSVGFSISPDNGDDITVSDFYYTFPLGDRITATVAANGVSVDELVASTISPFDSGALGSVSNFGFPQQYDQADAGSGAGAGAIIQLTDNLSLDFGYIASTAANNDSGNGLFNGSYSAIGQLTFLSGRLDAALTYVHAYRNDGGDDFVGNGGNAATSNTYGGQFNFRLNDTIEIGGGGGVTDVQGGGSSSDYDLWTYQGTLAFNDIGGEGNLLGILAGVPPYVGGGDTGFLVEGFYRYRLNSNIALTPSVIWLADPFNNNDLDDTIIGSLRTTFTF